MTFDARSRYLSFGDFRLDCRSGELRKSKREIRLQPQPAKLLVLLANRRGDVVTRAEIQKALWGEDTFVDFEHGINFSVKQIRDALGDDAEKPRYVETVPRVGYRFIARAEALSPDGADDRSPYPGLSSFTLRDSSFFFGREGEVESLRRKLESRQMLALIGPSGSGKSSFLRAGLLPSLPAGFRAVLFTPGSAPMRGLTRALAPEISGDAEAVQDLVEDAVAAATRWRKHCERALVVIDAFEELFTLNPPEAQAAFASTIGRLASEADVQVLLSMRDDFLFRCHDYEDLAPVFSELTPLGPLRGPALRRALVEPALSCGYQFETEELVEEMLREVVGGRGALPLLAFAAAQLWEKRDRERKLLTREAYEENGRVGGALARHAESTLERIGASNLRVVRELFRNLVTAQGTRSSREVAELLSVFPKEDERRAAEEVLRELVAARLLTAYETSVEIIHESLLSAWPRLVRWQTQDADGAQLRDQLRQAAKAWQDRGRPDDLLWTGKSFRELSLWRESYAGGLSKTEEDYADSAMKLAGRRRGRRRIATAVSFIVLLGVVGVFFSLWRRSVLEVSRREAAQILALGRLELEDRPTAALAHALASLERADSAEARRFAVEALWHGAAAVVLERNANTADFSPDGKWLATGGVLTGVRLWSREGGSPKTLRSDFSVRFSPASDFLAVGDDKTVRFLSIPEGSNPREYELEGDTYFRRRGSHLLSFTETSEKTLAVRDWTILDRDPGVVASLDVSDVDAWDVDASGEWFITARGKGVYVSPLRDPSLDRIRLVGQHEAKVVRVASHPTVSRILSSDETGEIRIWSFSQGSWHLERTFKAPAPQAYLDSTDTWMVVTPQNAHSTPDVAYVWDLSAPPDADPLVMRNGDVTFLNSAAIDPRGQWLTTANAYFGILWPLHAKYSRVLRGQSAPQIAIAFTPDGSGLVSTSEHDGTVRFWPLSPRGSERSRTLMEDETARLGWVLSMDPTGRYVLVLSQFDPSVILVPIHGGEPRRMPGFTAGQGWAQSHDFSPDGRFAVASGRYPNLLRVWDLDSGNVRMLETRVADQRCGAETKDKDSVLDLKFLADGRLLTVGDWGIRIWDLEDGSNQEIRPCTPKGVTDPFLAIDRDRRRFLLADVSIEARVSTLSFYDLETGASREISSHGNRVRAVALDPTGEIAVTGGFDGVVRVGPVTGEEPHLLFGHSLEISSVAVSPDGKWIASGSQDGTIRLWPMPEGMPFHTLPYEEILQRLRGLTNLRVVPDESADTGYRVEAGPFPGWKKLPSW